MLTQVDAMFEGDEERSIGRGRVGPGASARAARFNVGKPPIGDETFGNPFREGTATGVACANEEQSHRKPMYVSGIANQRGHAFAQHTGSQYTGPDHARTSSRAVDDRRRR